MTKSFVILFKAFITILLLYIVINDSNFDVVVALLLNFNFNFYFFIFFILILQIMLVTFRWRKILLHMNKRYNFLGLLRCFWTGYFFNQILPSNIGGDAFRGYCIYKNGESIKNSISSIVIDRLFGIIGLILLFILTILMLPDLTNIFELEFSVIFSIFIALFSIIILNNFLRDSSWKLARGLRHISHIMRSIIFKSLCGIRLIMLSFSVHVLSVVIVIALSEGLNLNIHFTFSYIAYDNASFYCWMGC